MKENWGGILLPRRYLPPGTKPDNVLDVFIYLDSEDRLGATTETPHAMIGEFAYLTFVRLNQNNKNRQ
jgi:predicted RNA-binding protein (virulence factor B family)